MPEPSTLQITISGSDNAASSRSSTRVTISIQTNQRSGEILQRREHDDVRLVCEYVPLLILRASATTGGASFEGEVAGDRRSDVNTSEHLLNFRIRNVLCRNSVKCVVLSVIIEIGWAEIALPFCTQHRQLLFVISFSVDWIYAVAQQLAEEAA